MSLKDEIKAQKAKKAKNLRWKKPIVRDLNLEAIQEDLSEMTGECDEIKYFIETSDEETLINALCGDEDEVTEFKMAFADLSAECEQMWNDMQDAYVPEWFDILFVAVGAGDYEGGTFGWDEYVGDYYGLDPFDTNEAVKNSREKLKKHTKDELIDGTQACLKVLYAYLGLKDRYTNLKAAIDILKGQNMDYLNLVKNIEAAYDETQDKFHDWSAENRFDSLVNNLPWEAWLW